MKMTPYDVYFEDGWKLECSIRRFNQAQKDFHQAVMDDFWDNISLRIRTPLPVPRTQLVAVRPHPRIRSYTARGYFNKEGK